jgi:hypothetical protein
MRIIGGIVFVFIGLILFLTSIGDKNSAAMIGGLFLSLLFFVFGVFLFPIKGNSPVKQCPFCKEDIKFEAIKCKHCGTAI